jgi:Putative zinc-finger
MSCLSLERLYAYLERELSSPENRDIEGHLAVCPKCRDAVEERRRMLQAIETLPAFDVPPDFAKGVMDRISTAPAKVKVSFVRWLAAGVAGFLAFSVALAIFALLTGHSLSQFFIRLNRGLWSYVQVAVSGLAKFAKFVILAFKIAGQFLQELLESLRAFASLISPEAQVIFVCSSLLLVLAGGLLLRRKFFLEKNHEK